MAAKSKQTADASAAVEVAKLSFESALTELEQMIERIESGSVGLEESLTEYERGVKLFHHCRTILD